MVKGDRRSGCPQICTLPNMASSLCNSNPLHNENIVHPCSDERQVPVYDGEEFQPVVLVLEPSTEFIVSPET